MKALLQKIRKILRDRKVRRAFTRIVGGVSALAVFITTYALILPAITMETEAMCGIEAHQHDDSCYSEELICEIPESDGHHHTDECYTITRKLICELQEHVHTQETGCYDEEGNLICELQAHEHDDQCYKEVRTLTCGLEESDGHHHGPECYKKVLACGMEVHTHSEECYKDTSRAVVASTSMTAEPAQTDMVDSNAETEDAGSASDELSEEDFDAPTENAGLSTAEAVETADELLTEETDGDKDDVSDKLTEESTNPSNQADDLLTDILSADETSSNTGSASDELTADDLDTSTETDASPSAETADAAAEATTDVLPEEIQEEDLSDGFIPSLDPLYMEAMLTKETAFYYYHPEDGETVEDSSAINNWKKASEKTELAPTDLVRMYLPYTIPAGSLNQTNQIARYRLPAGIRFTDDQIININQNVNGVAASCLDGGAAEDANDGENSYEKYLGSEAVEGKRRPDQELREGETEYVSAVVKVENIFDDSTGEYEGQDLIFIFTPYTIEENQNVYDRDGDMTAKGRKVSGWFAMDFNMSQIEWVEDEFDEDLDNTTIGKTASFLFTAKDKENDVNEIRRELRLVEKVSEGITAEDISDETDQSAAAETTAAAEEASEGAAETAVAAQEAYEGTTETVAEHASEIASADTTLAASESAAETATENAAQTETASAAETADAAAADNTAGAAAETSETPEEYTSGTLEATGDGYRITLDYTAEAKIPANADLQVREITEASDKEAYEACLEEAKKQVAEDDKSTVDKTASRFFDIEIIVKSTDENGTEAITKVEPASAVSVNIQLIDTSANQSVSETVSEESSSQTSDPTVLHFAKDGVETMKSTTEEKQEENAENTEEESAQIQQIQFEAESFSVYGVVYTVDFYWEVNGKTFEFSLTGGDSVGVRSLVESLGIAKKTDSSEKETTEEADEAIVDEFINDIDQVEFSDESLVKPVQITEGITAGALKDKLGLECEYSAELTAAQREQMDSKVYYAPDWALISLKAFSSEEHLTVEMKTGEVFRIKVTDAQISKDYIAASGETYTITVVYDETAQIPEGADLNVRELIPGTEEYVNYLRTTAQKLDLVSNDLSFARFFDIEIIHSGKKIEPKAPVRVQITYKNAMQIDEDDQLSVVHFKDEGLEVITNLSLNDEKNEIVYEQSSFSVTGTIVTAGTQTAGMEGDPKHMMIVKYEGEYYIVNNDATLTKVTSDSSENPPQSVTVDDPMLWSYSQSGNSKHIYFNSEATGFGPNLVASDYYRRYLDPSSDQAWLQEQSEDSNKDSYVTVTGKYMAGDPYGTFGPTNENGWFTTHDENGNEVRIQCTQIADDNARNKPLAATSLTITDNGGTSTISHNGNYLSVQCDAAGTPVRLVGGETDSSKAAQFMFANADKVVAGLHSDHAVNHIDISISGAAHIKVPLAYGKYYDANGNVILNVKDNVKVTLTEDQVFYPEGSTVDPLEITPEDMKRAAITARDKNGNMLDDVFYISGFSQNAVTAYSTAQVRIDGKFLVSDLRNDNDPEIRHLNDSKYYGGFNGYQFWWPDQNYVNRVNQARKDNVIDYTVNVIKPVTYYLVNPENPAEYLYDHEGNLMTVTVDVAFSGSFNYWDYGKTAKNSGNECPPLQGNQAWRNGDIPNHDLSGMDFKLAGDAENPNSPLVAIEITKVIMDDKGNRIDVKIPVTSTFDIYESKAADRNSVQSLNVNGYQREWDELLKGQNGEDLYSKLRTRSITIGDKDNGSNLIYDYNVTDAMYYIVEHSDNDLEKTVTDKSDNVWQYSKTYIETEYVRRGDEHDDHLDPMHFTKEYSLDDGTNGFKSVPEVAGIFTTPSGERKKSGFLEFFVYNVYTRGKELPVEKEWAEGTEVPEGAEVTVELRYATKPKSDTTTPWPPADKSTYNKVSPGTAPFDSYREEGQEASGEEENKPTLQTKLTLSNGTSWKGTFRNLPETVEINGVEHVVDYYAVETSIKVPGDGKDTIDDTAIDKTAEYWKDARIENGTVILTNEKNTTQLPVEKKWANDTHIPENAEVTVELRYAAKIIKNADGTVPTEGSNIDFPRTQGGAIDYSQYQPVKVKAAEGETYEFADFFKNSSSFNTQTPLDTVKTLRADAVNTEKNWRDVFTGLPKYLNDNSGVTWELDYYAVETAVKVPGENDTMKDVTANYTHEEKKEEADSVAGTNSDGKVTITNKEVVVVKVKKVWQPTPAPDGAFAEVQLKRYKKASTEPPTPTTESTVKKVWDDDNDKEGKRPQSIQVKLYADGVEQKTIMLTANDNWEHTEENLNKTSTGGSDIVYTWQETSVPEGYTMTSAVNGNVTTITNRYSATGPETISLRVVKVWDDGNNRDGKRPESLDVKLLANGTEKQTVELNKTNQWNMIVPDLPTKTEQGDPIAYTWEEVVPEQVAQDYPEADRTIVTEGTVTTITNKHTPEKTSASIEVIWVDENNASGKRPDSLSVTLSDSQEVSLGPDTDPDKDWRATKTDLPKYLRGNEIQYSWNVPDVDGYTKEVTPGNALNGNVTTVTYTLKPVKDTVTVTVSAKLFREGEDDYADFWENSNWKAIIRQGSLNGSNFALLSNVEITANTENKSISFEVPKNSIISFQIDPEGSYLGTNVYLNSFLSPINIKTIGQIDQNDGQRRVQFKVGEDDLDIFAILSKKGEQEIEPGIPPVPNDKATVYVGVDTTENNHFNINSGEFSQILEGVPVNSVLSLYYTWNFNESNVGWRLFYLDKESELNRFIWKQVGDRHNHSKGATDDVTIGNQEEYLILIDRNFNERNNFEILLSEKTTGMNDGVKPQQDFVYKQLLSSTNMAARSLSPMLPSEPLMAESPKKAVTNNGHFVQDDIDFEQLTSDGYVEDTAFNNGTDPYSGTVTLTLKEGQGFGWEQSFPAQDKYDSEGNVYVYYVEEIDFSGDDYHTESITGDPNNGDTVVVRNVKDTPESGSLSLTKKITGSGADATKQFEFTISLTAPAGGELESSYPATHSDDSSISTATIVGGKVSNIQLKGGETYTINGLPVGTSYTITESDYSSEGYTPSVTAGESLTGTIKAGETSNEIEVTNTYSAVDITVVKIDETTRNKDNPSAQKKLPNATFKLYKLTTPPGGGPEAYTVYPDASNCEKTTGSNGELEYERLPNGRYKIEETGIPDGYITQEEMEFYFTVSEASTLTWTDSTGEAISDPNTVQKMVGFTPADKTFTVGNEPGPSLPSTGGPGTHLYYLLGSALAFFAVALFGIRRTRHGR